MKQSAGILLYRLVSNETEFLLVHPGGPFFRNRNEGWWTIPKGEPMAGEDLLDCAVREFKEETGYHPEPPYIALSPIMQKGGKQVHAWACQGNVEPASIICNTFEMEWPPKSGKQVAFPEIDKAGWYSFDEAVKLINERQVPLLQQAMSITTKGN